jgi:hypothetical protein
MQGRCQVVASCAWDPLLLPTTRSMASSFWRCAWDLLGASAAAVRSLTVSWHSILLCRTARAVAKDSPLSAGLPVQVAKDGPFFTPMLTHP